MLNQFLKIEQSYSIRELIEKITDSLDKSGIENPKFESRLILSYYMSLELAQLLANNDKKIIYTEKLDSLIKQRMLKIPIAYIVGYKEFYGRDFFVNKNVLIPRPDTETLVNAILTKYKNFSDLNILELGVGSGCIIITLIIELNCKGLGIDISQNALEIAQYNSKLHNCLDRLNLVHSDWFQNISPKSKFDIIVSNPPYINKVTESNMMSVDTLLYEPDLALYTECYASYKMIALHARNYLTNNGKIYLEIGLNQEEEIIKIFTKESYILKNSFYDLNKILRVLVFSV